MFDRVQTFIQLTLLCQQIQTNVAQRSIVQPVSYLIQQIWLDFTSNKTTRKGSNIYRQVKNLTAR